MLLFGAISAGIALAPGLQEWLEKFPFCKNSTATSAYVIPTEYTTDCSVAVGYLAVYRICFALVCFFTLMAMITIGAKSSRDPRAPIQNGFWGLKYMIVTGLAIAAFFIPAGAFGTVWMWIGLIGGVAFIIVQLMLIVDFAHNWAEAWVGKCRMNSILLENDANLLDLFFFFQIITTKVNLVAGTVLYSVLQSFNTLSPPLGLFCSTFITIAH